MGGIFGRIFGRKPKPGDPNFSPYNDPFYPGMSQGGFGMPLGGYPMAPPYPYGGGYDPGGMGEYDPYDIYGYGGPTNSFETYGGRMGGGPYNYGRGRYGRGKVLH